MKGFCFTLSINLVSESSYICYDHQSIIW